MQIQTFGMEQFPAGKVTRLSQKLGQLNGLQAYTHVMNCLTVHSKAMFRDCPALLKESQVDLLLVDQIIGAAPVIAQRMNIPYITVCNAAILTCDPGFPSPLSHRVYTGSCWNQWLNSIEQHFINCLSRPFRNIVHEKQREYGLKVSAEYRETDSKLAVIAQMTHGFDFPRSCLPHYHFVGKLTDPCGIEPMSKHAEFDWSVLDNLGERKLVYASIGTVQNGIKPIYNAIASACKAVGAKLVMTLGRKRAETWEVAGDATFVSFAPQEQLIARADVVITHAGANTALTSLQYGKPVVAIPIANDQAGMAARVVHSGVGRRVRLDELRRKDGVKILTKALQAVLENDGYRERARQVMREIEESGGVSRAADVVERVMETKQAVPRSWRR